jgi:hypothetical protein
MSGINSHLQNNSCPGKSGTAERIVNNSKASKRLMIGCMGIIILAIVIKVIISRGSYSGSTINLAAKSSLNGLDISVTSFEISDSLPNGWIITSPQEGTVYAIAGIKVYNDGEMSYSFLNGARSTATIEYDKKEFQMMIFSSAPDGILYSERVDPMMSKEGLVVFQIPEQLADKQDKMKLKINERQVDEKTGRLGTDVKSVSFKLKGLKSGGVNYVL